MITKATINSKLKQDLYRIQAFADTLSLNLMLGEFVISQFCKSINDDWKKSFKA